MQWKGIDHVYSSFYVDLPLEYNHILAVLPLAEVEVVMVEQKDQIQAQELSVEDP